MNTENFVVRPHRELVEKYSAEEAWSSVDVNDVDALAHTVATLPTELPAEPEEARRFDLLILTLQLVILKIQPGFAPLRDRVKAIAGLLEEYSSIPGVAVQMELLADLQTEDWWEGVTLPMLEDVRKRLRLLVQFIEKNKRKIVYTDFADEMGKHAHFPFGGFTPHSEFEQFRKKALAFLKDHKGEAAVEKVHHNWPITAADMTELKRILVESGVGTDEDCERADANLAQLVRQLEQMASRPLWREGSWVFCDRCGCSVDTALIHPDGHHYADDGDFYCADCWSNQAN